MEGDDLLARQKELLSTFRRGAELAEELLRDNEQLVTQMQSLGRRYEERLALIERENQSLASLYVAAYQLHASHQPAVVLRTIVEILVNFVGAKTFAVYLRGGEQLRAVAGEGLDPAALDELADVEPLAPRGPDGREPLVVRSLKVGDRVVGAVAIWELLAQKPGLEDVDAELLSLLGTHAGLALEAARLAERST